MLIDRVADLLLQAAREAILPRFNRLQEGDVIDKAAGEVVTGADHHSERIITAGLLALMPHSRVIGEEACAACPDLMKGMADGSIWLVDPLDGTGNFVSGRPPFSIMAALLHDGETVASWMLDPLTGQICIAEKGSGAFIDGTRIETHQAPARQSQLTGAVLGRFIPEPIKNKIHQRAQQLKLVPGLLCAGAEYPEVARGDRHFAIFWRTLPWDHGPGALFLEEAGGHVMRPDGSPYHVGCHGAGLIVARNRAIGADVMSLLFG